jgi:hypothetical protein
VRDVADALDAVGVGHAVHRVTLCLDDRSCLAALACLAGLAARHAVLWGQLEARGAEALFRGEGAWGLCDLVFETRDDVGEHTVGVLGRTPKILGAELAGVEP